MVKVLSWNIKQGGGSRIPGILQTIQEQDPDLIVLTEFVRNGSGDEIVRSLRDRFPFSSFGTESGDRRYSVAILSRIPFEGEILTELGENSHRVIRARFTDPDLTLYGMYFPQREKKYPLFEFVAERTLEETGDLIFLGDFNTGKHLIDEEGQTFFCAEWMDELERIGLKDAFRDKNGDRREYTWFNHRSGSGFRIDHAFFRFNRIELRECSYDPIPREMGYSDHSVMIVEVEGQR